MSSGSTSLDGDAGRKGVASGAARAARHTPLPGAVCSEGSILQQGSVALGSLRGMCAPRLLQVEGYSASLSFSRTVALPFSFI